MANRQRLNEWWKGVAPRLQKALGLAPLTRKEADEAMANAPEVEISEDELDALVRKVTETDDGN